METKIIGIKQKMETFFDSEGKALASTLVVGENAKFGEVFQEGEEVTVKGISKGKGFAGVVKRHHFAGGPRTHGQSDRERAPGSIGSTTTPGRVLKGKRMAGRMGGQRITLKNVKILKIDSEKNIMYLKGPLPGVRRGKLEIIKNDSH